MPPEPEDHERLLRRLRADRESPLSLARRTPLPDLDDEDHGSQELLTALTKD